VNNLLDYPIDTTHLQLSRMSTQPTPVLTPEQLSHNTTLSVVHHDSDVLPATAPTVGPTSIQTNETEASPVIAPPMQDSKYIDITEYLNLPQSQAAKKIHVPTSTLSKRWKEAVRNRKWPYRAVCKLDKEIMTILYNIPQTGEAQSDDLPPDVKAKLGRLLRER